MFRFSSGGDEAGQGSPLFGGANHDSPRSRRSQQSGQNSNGRGSGSGGGRRGGFPFGFGKRGRRAGDDAPTPPQKRTPPPSPFDDDHNMRVLSGLTLGQRQQATLDKVKQLYADDELDVQSYRINQVKILQSHLGALDYDGLHEAAKNLGTAEDIDGVEVDEDGEVFIEVQELRNTLIFWLKRGQFDKLALALKAPPQTNGASSSSSSADAEMKYAPSASSSSNRQPGANKPPPQESADSENDEAMRDVVSLLESTEPSTSVASRELELAMQEYLKGQQEARAQMLNSKFLEACSVDPALLTFAQSLRVEMQRFALDSKNKVTVPARMTSLNISADVNFVATIHFVGGKSFNCSVAMTTLDTPKRVDVYAALFELKMSSSSSSSPAAAAPVVSSTPLTEKISVPELSGALDVGAEVPDSLLKDVMRALCRVCAVNLF